jgi:PAS domain S-box-containing protein
MKRAPIPHEEVQRLAELKSLNILDTKPEETFDEITKMAANITQCKIALVSLVDQDRQWFKSKFGLEASQTPRDISFCGHAICQDDIFIVEDAEIDERFCDNPLFLGEPHVRFYAGVPLKTNTGHRIGTLCVIDPEKKELSEVQIITLKSLASHVVDLLELRFKNQELIKANTFFSEVQRLARISSWELKKERFNFQEEFFNTYDLEKEVIRESIEKEILVCVNTILDGKYFEKEFYVNSNSRAKKIFQIVGVFNSEEDSFIGTLQDLTLERSTQENLELAVRELNQFFDLNLNYLCIAGLDGRFRKINKAWLSLGYDQDELLQTPFINFVHEEDRESTLSELNSLGTGLSVVNFENRYRKKDGSYIYLSWTTSPDVASGLVFAVAVDITEAKKKELISLEISQLRAQYIENSLDRRKFFNFLLDKLLILTDSEYGFIGEILEDENGKFLKTYSITDISWNEETRNFYQENAPKGLVFRNLNTLFGEVIKTGELIMANDAPRHPKASGIPKGHPVLKKFFGIPIFSRNQFIAMVGLANRPHDYTHELYQELKPYLDLVGEMLRAMMMEAELEHQKKLTMHNSRLAMIGQLAAGVGHEINNPLQILMGHLSLAKNELKRESLSKENIFARFDKMQVAINRITNIVTGLRTFARSDSLEISSFNLCELVKETIDMIFDIYRKDDVEISYHCPQRSEIIEGNRGRIQQVLMNLIANAKDASEGRNNRKIEVNVVPDGEYLKLIVSDNGKGIPNDLRDKIFEPFFTTKDVNKGTGIGLALANTIVREHGGKLEFKSELNQGTSFFVSLPFLR